MTTIPATAAPRPIRSSLLMRLFVFNAVIFGGGAVTLALWTSDNGPLLLPLAVLTVAVTFFFLVLIARQKGAPFFQIGGFFGMMTFLYAAYPAVVYLARGMRYGPRNDDRLLAAAPTASQLGSFEWWYVAFFVTFAAIYLLLTRGPATERFGIASPKRGIVIVTAAAYGFVSLALTVISIAYPYGSDGQTYGETYLVLQRLPMIVRQAVGTMWQMQATLLVMITVALFTQYRRRRIWIALLVVWVSASTILAMQSRTPMFVLLFVVGCLYHNLIRRIPLRVALAGVVAALAALAWLGAVRESRSGVGAKEAFGGSSEFEVILANAYDLKYVQHAEGALLHNPVVYLSDFAAVVPQQFLPFAKQTKAEWYLATYWPQVAAGGGGYAFGLLAEGVTGFGLGEILLRAVLAGVVFGLLQRRMARRPASFWLLTTYVWLTVLSYQILRATAFSLLQRAEYHLLLPIIGVRLVYFVLLRSRQRLRRIWRLV
jgi:hypothetical protein